MDMHAHGDVVTMSDLMDRHEVQFAETSSGVHRHTPHRVDSS